MSLENLRFDDFPSREFIVENIEERLSRLRKQKPSDENRAQINLLARALTLENKILLSGTEVHAAGEFSTGYAGRKGIHWEYSSHFWSGRLFNRTSGIVKKQSGGETAEEMLRGLMPTK